MKWYRKSIDADKQNQYSYLGLGNCYMVRENYARAEEVYKNALQLDSEFAYGMLRLAELYEAGKDPAKAIEYYREYLAAWPDAPDAEDIKTRIESLGE